MRVSPGRSVLFMVVAGLLGIAVTPTGTLLSGFGIATPTVLQWRGAELLRIWGAITASVAFVGAVLPRSMVCPDCPRSGDDVDTSDVIWMVGGGVVALLLRLIALGEGLWVDEVATLVNHVRLPAGQILFTYESNNHHMLFSLLAHGSIALFGESAWALRLPAAVMGALTIPTLYLLAHDVGGRRLAIPSAVLLAIWPQHVWFSQNARGYSGLLLFTVLSSFFCLRGLRAPGNVRPWRWYAVTVALGLYTHMTMVFVVLGQMIALAVAWYPAAGEARRWRCLLVGLGGAILMTLLLYAPVLPQMPEASARDVSTVATWRSVNWLILESLQGLGFGPHPYLVTVAGILVGGLGLVGLWRAAPAVAIMAVVSVASGGSLMIALGHHLWPRFFFYVAGFGVMALVLSIDDLGRTIGHRAGWSSGGGRAFQRVGIGGLFLALLWHLPGIYGPKQDYEGAKAFVQGAMSPGDGVASVGVAATAMRAYYAPSWSVVHSAQELRTLAAGYHRTWLVFTLPVEMRDLHPDVLEELTHGWQRMARFPGTLGGGDLEVYMHDRDPDRERK